MTTLSTIWQPAQTVVIESDIDNVADSALLEPLSAVDVEAGLNNVEFFFLSDAEAAFKYVSALHCMLVELQFKSKKWNDIADHSKQLKDLNWFILPLLDNSTKSYGSKKPN